MLAFATLAAILYLAIGAILGAYFSLKNGYKKHNECFDIMDDFAIKWPKIILYGIKAYFNEKKKKRDLQKPKIYIDTSR